MYSENPDGKHFGTPFRNGKKNLNRMSLLQTGKTCRTAPVFPMQRSNTFSRPGSTSLPAATIRLKGTRSEPCNTISLGTRLQAGGVRCVHVGEDMRSSES